MIDLNQSIGAADWQRLDLATRTLAVARMCVVSLRRHWLAWTAVIGGVLLFNQFFGFGLNMSPSLPHTLYIVHKGAPVSRGDYAAFAWPGGGPYKTGQSFIKVVAGAAGDVVTRDGREFYVNGKPMGAAKTHSKKGVELEMGPVGALQQGDYYMYAPHPDSLDSRYALTGWVKETQMIGRAYVLF